VTTQLALWIVLSGILLGVAGLFVTVLARGMEKKIAKAAVAHGEEDEDSEAIAAVLPKGVLGNAIKHHLLTSSADTRKDAIAAAVKAQTKKKSGVAAAIVGAMATIGVSTGIVSNLFDEDIDVASLAPTEVAAGNLHGTLLMPKKNSPIVLIIPGSGPTDRDGNSPLGVKAEPYKLLAEALASEGIATVRVDKRGMFGSAAAGDPNAVTVDQYAQDYRAWIDTLRAQTGRDCIFLLGHSEGALMATAAAEGRKDVCGLILVAGMGRKFGDVIREQLQANPANGPLLDQAFAALADLEAGRHVDVTNMNPALMPLFAPPVQDFLISMMAVDPVEAVRRAKQETLIVQGTHDLQVTVADARLLNKAPDTKLRLINDMNHVLKEAPEDRAENLTTYMDPSLPLHPDLVEAMDDFIRKND
jgi:uncharacterized protein